MSQSNQRPLSDLAEFLSHTLIFDRLPPTQLEDIAALAISQLYNKGDILFQEGDDGNGFFVVKSGRVKVFKLSADGKEQILHVFRRGDHFAEVPALDGQCFPASAAALEKAEVLFFPRQSFLELLERQPALTINLLKSFARHLRLFSHLIDDLALRDVPARLAMYLMNAGNTDENPAFIELDLPKSQLAARLGTIPETLSRVFAKLNRDGLLEINGSRVNVLDWARLRRLAMGTSDPPPRDCS